jgi:hypothetical protein
VPRTASPSSAAAPVPTAAPRVDAPVAAQAAPAAPATKEVELVVKAGKLASGDTTIKLQQGDEVTLRITTDKADELHLHGYDKHMHLRAGVPAELKLRADRTGRFPFELHKSHLELGTLEVYPR